MAPQPKIHIHLRASLKTCFLNCQPHFSLVVLLTLSSERPVTFIKNGTGLHAGLAQLLISKCIECTDIQTGQPIPVLDSKTKPQPSTSNAESPDLMGLEPKRTNYVTFTTATNPRAYEFEFASSGLEPDRSYAIRCNAAVLQWWSYKSVEEIGDYFDAKLELPSSETPPLRLESDNTISFDTRAEMEKAPTIDVSLSAPSTLSVSGNALFEYSLTFISNATKPITVRFQRQGSTSTNTQIEILNNVTRRRVAPDLIDVHDDDKPFLPEDFLRLNPGKPHAERSVLNPFKRYSGLEDLKVNTGYVLHMIESHWWWSYDGIDDVIKYASERGNGGLRPTQPIDLISCNEINFRTVQ